MQETGTGSDVRRDILLKTILRDFRKFYSQDFNKSTKYNLSKRRKSPEYYLICLIEYFKKSLTGFKEVIETNLNKEEIPKDINELLLFFGGFLYPKSLIQSITD